MKLAAVIDVGHGPAALEQAIKTQMSLLDCLGVRLDSIRLAASHLLRHACLSAIDEAPDMLVMAGGPRASRRAGQLAHQRGVPILFLPGFRVPEWVRTLWGPLSLDDMIAALARDEIGPAELHAGSAGGHLFFGRAVAGLSPNLAEVRNAMENADEFSEGWRALMRGMSLASSALRGCFWFRADDSGLRPATALIANVRSPDAGDAILRDTARPLFACEAWKDGLLRSLGGALRATLRGDWRCPRSAEHFVCRRFLIETKRPTWLLLDGDPVRFCDPVEFKFVSSPVQTFAFRPGASPRKDDVSTRRSRLPSTSAPEPPWNLPRPSFVAPKDRGSGNRRHN